MFEINKETGRKLCEFETDINISSSIHQEP